MGLRYQQNFWHERQLLKFVGCNTEVRCIIDSAKGVDCLLHCTLDLVFLRYVTMNGDTLRWLVDGTNAERCCPSDLGSVLLNISFTFIECLLVLNID